MKPEILKSWSLEIDYSRAPCHAADQKERGFWERDQERERRPTGSCFPISMRIRNLVCFYGRVTTLRLRLGRQKAPF